ncbi:LysR family transcriptional regulator [Halomonas sp. H2]|uniref:LysR family transcriptional regulator n=1 Tax=Halomonas sp. H2 TaxID=261936 RepID=UPI003CF180A9
MSNLSIGQLEALFWVVELGTFSRAAEHLNTTQSTISKRIQELEYATGLTLFDRARRGSRVTKQGEILHEHARQMMELRDRVMSIRNGDHHFARKFRLGVTELTALTWMPRFATLLRQNYPEVLVEPSVDMSRSLYEGLMEGRLDVIIVPEVVVDNDIHVYRLADVDNAWMASPDFLPGQPNLELREICNCPVITQGSRSGAGLFFIRWLKTRGLTLENTVHADSMMAAVALAVAGFGIAYLPRDCFEPLVKSGKLVEMVSNPPLSPTSYSLVVRRDLPSAFYDDIARVAVEACDFTIQYQETPGSGADLGMAGQPNISA